MRKNPLTYLTTAPLTSCQLTASFYELWRRHNGTVLPSSIYRGSRPRLDRHVTSTPGRSASTSHVSPARLYITCDAQRPSSHATALYQCITVSSRPLCTTFFVISVPLL